MDTRETIAARNVATIPASSGTELPSPERLESPVPRSTYNITQRRWVMWLAALGALVLVLLVARADIDQLAQTAHGIAPHLLILPLLATLGSYLTMALSYQRIARMAGYPLPFAEMCRITLVANTANYLLSTGGLSGFALRMCLFARRGIPTASAVLISLVQTLLTNLILLGFIAWGFTLLLFSHNLVGRDIVAAAALLVSFGIVVIAGCAALLRRQWRRGLLYNVTRLIDRVLALVAPQRKPSRSTLIRLQHNLHIGLDFLLKRPQEMLVPALYIVLDWSFTLLVLYSAFLAIGAPIAMSHTIAGFAIGMFFSMASLVPGGLGIMDGSMVAVFVTLGVQFEQAVVAILIFRAAYYGIPILASLILTPQLLRT